MKTKCLLLLGLILLNSYAYAQDDDMIIPDNDDETFIPPAGDQSSNTPPVIIDESDSADVSDVEEYDG